MRWGKDEKDIKARYDTDNDTVWWSLVNIQWLVDHNYTVVDSQNEAMFDMNGNPVSYSTKAAEASPKYVPPLFEEREV